jgi:hypothetical protein
MHRFCICIALLAVWRTIECVRMAGFLPVSSYSPLSEQSKKIKVVAAVAKKKEPSFIDNFFECIRLYQRGVLNFPDSLSRAKQIWQKQRRFKSELVLSYTERKLLEKAKSDLFSLAKLAFTWRISTELLVYSYVLIPLLSYQNPWSFKEFPSTFLDPVHKDKIARSFEQRKVQAVVKAFEAMQDDRVADGTEGSIERRDEHLALVESVLKQRSSLEKAIEVLEPVLLVPKKHPKKLRWKNIPPIAIGEAIRGLVNNGALPNIPLIRRLNIGKLEGHLNQMEKEDNFLVSKGVTALENEEVKLACTDRGIFVGKKDPKQLRQQLQEWLSIATKPDASVGLAHAAGMKTNTIDRRLALIGLSIVRDLPQNDFAQPYLSLFQK